MTDNDGPAISVERLLLTSDGEYAREGLAIRGRDFHAIGSAGRRLVNPGGARHKEGAWSGTANPQAPCLTWLRHA
jgi:hypothetical protein